VAPRIVLALAAAAAVVQAAIASRWHDDYFGALAVGWVFALALVHARRSSLEWRAAGWERTLGALVFAASLAAMILSRERYSTVHRLLPLATGLGLAVLATGVRRVPRLTRELALLGLPLVHPLPVAVERLLEHLPQTAALAAFYLRAVGFPVDRLGTLLLVPGSAVEVADGCGGTGTTSLLLALATLVACVFRTTLSGTALLAATAVAWAFAGNAARVACLAVIASRAPHRFDDFDGRGAGAPIFTVVIAAAALAGWWALLRARGPGHRRASARSPEAA
jgi:exosortase